MDDRPATTVQGQTPRRRRHSGRQGLAQAVVGCALYRDGRRVDGGGSLAEAHRRACEEGPGFVWVGLHEPDEAAIATVAQEFDLHPLAVEDAVHAHQRPKLDVYDDMLFLVLKTVRYVDHAEVIETGEVMVFMGPSFVVTVRHGEADGLSEVRALLESQPEVLRLGPFAVLWAVADHVVDGYGPAVLGVEVDVEEVEDQVFGEARTNPTQRIYRLKREVLEFTRAVVPLSEATGRLARGDFPGAVEQGLPWLRDVHDHVLRAGEQVQGLDALLQGTLDANVAQVTLRQNADMRRISAYAAILTVCTTIAGIYGMNFEHMPELGWSLGYPFALALMAGVSTLLYRAFKRNGWL